MEEGATGVSQWQAFLFFSQQDIFAFDKTERCRTSKTGVPSAARIEEAIMLELGQALIVSRIYRRPFCDHPCRRAAVGEHKPSKSIGGWSLDLFNPN